MLYIRLGQLLAGIHPIFLLFGKVICPFDEAKYKALLDGLEAVELKLSEVLEDNETLRIDSEYFKKSLNIQL